MTKQEKTITINGLMKVGKINHISELQNQGKLYCNTVKYFREIEHKDSNRRDSREGAFKTELIDPETLTISVEGEKLPVTFNYARLNQFDSNRDNFKLYCMFGFKNKHALGEPFIDERNIDFGERALIITNTEEFVTRVIDKLEEMNLDHSYDYVTYYKEKSINDQLSVFHKPKKFSYQSEFRFFIKEPTPEPLIFRIGSIEDISLIIDSNKLPKLSLNPK